MKNKLELLPGVPNDQNREYLPEKIKGTDMVVNESGNNSQRYPERLKEYHETLKGGFEGTWYEYIPSTYDPDRKTPLVFSFHGGLMTGWGQCVYSSWTVVAEREGIIIVYPDGHVNRFWSSVEVPGQFVPKEVAGVSVPDPPRSIEESYDANFILALMDKIKEKYNIDETRIFMQGMSNGSGMTQQMARFYGNKMTGACISAGPHPLITFTDGKGNLVNRGGPVDIWLTLPENNSMATDRAGEVQRLLDTLYYWCTVNKAISIPEINVVDKDNFAFFFGEKGDVTFLDVKNRDHGQALDEACICWDYMFSGSERQSSGKLVHVSTKAGRKGDPMAAAFTENSDYCLWHNQRIKLPVAPLKWMLNKYHGLNGGNIVRGEYLMVPLSFLARFAGAEYVLSEDTFSATLIFPNGRTAKFARGIIGCLIDDTMRAMPCETLHRNGELMVDVTWFSEYFLNRHVSVCNNVVYITDHSAHLSYYMAEIIKLILNENRIFADDYIKKSLDTWEKKGKNEF